MRVFDLNIYVNSSCHITIEQDEDCDLHSSVEVSAFQIDLMIYNLEEAKNHANFLIEKKLAESKTDSNE